MQNRLKALRGQAGLTQAELAEKVGVSQPTYQRWESKSAPIPGNRLNRLALALGTTPEALQDRHAPVEAVLYSDKEDDEAGYWGEAAFHFQGGGEPLLLTISDHAYPRLYRDLQSAEPFLVVKSMANQTVVIRRGAIKDVYMSSEAYDTFGPEEGNYKRFDHIMLPDARDWAIIAAMSDAMEDDFDPEDVERISNRIMITDEQFATLVANGRIAPEDLEVEKARVAKQTDLYFSLATETTWQFSDGKRRSVRPEDAHAFYSGMAELVDVDLHLEGECLVRLESAERHRIIFLNRDSIDYATVPTHAYEAALDEVAADEIEEMA